jgi:hypothetical protein
MRPEKTQRSNLSTEALRFGESIVTQADRQQVANAAT